MRSLLVTTLIVALAGCVMAPTGAAPTAPTTGAAKEPPLWRTVGYTTLMTFLVIEKQKASGQIQAGKDTEKTRNRLGAAEELIGQLTMIGQEPSLARRQALVQTFSTALANEFPKRGDMIAQAALLANIGVAVFTPPAP